MRRIHSFTAVAVLSALVVSAAVHAQGSTPSTPSTPPATSAAPAKSTNRSSTYSHKSKQATPKIDLNSASREQLMKLPGVTEAIADKIIAARPFKAKDELVSKNLVSKKEYEGISAHVTVKQEHVAAGATK